MRKNRKKGVRNTTFFPHGFFINFGSILEGFGRPNGGQDGPRMGKLGVKKATKDRIAILEAFGHGLGRVLGGFGEGFGRVWGGIGEGLGRVLNTLGVSWALVM